MRAGNSYVGVGERARRSRSCSMFAFGVRTSSQRPPTAPGESAGAAVVAVRWGGGGRGVLRGGAQGLGCPYLAHLPGGFRPPAATVSGTPPVQFRPSAPLGD